MGVRNRVAIVTGGAQGIGLAIATLLAERGAKVVLTDINADKAIAQAEALCAKGRMLFLSLWEACAAKPDNASLYQRCHEMGDILLGAKRLGRSKTLKDGTAGGGRAVADGSGEADRGGGAVAGGNGATASDGGEADRGGGAVAGGGRAVADGSGAADLKSVAPMEKSRLIGR